MRFSFASAALLGVALAEQPCAQVASTVQKTGGYVDADLALQCLQSVPIDTKGDELQLLGLSTFVNFQTTLAYLKDPTPGYSYPAVDVQGTLSQMKSKLQSGGYTQEYDFQNDLLKLWNSVHDGHFIYWPDITQIFSWQRSTYLYSVSTDGTAVPQAYVFTDLPIVAGLSKASYTPSAVSKINGQDVETFLEDIANSTSINNMDPDAAYNQLFPIVPTASTNQGAAILFSTNTIYQGTDTVLTFKNGSTLHVETTAFTTADFSGVTDGSSFFQKFCHGKIPPASSLASAPPAESSSVASTSSQSLSSVSATSGSASASASASASSLPASSSGATRARRDLSASSTTLPPTGSSHAISGSASATASGSAIPSAADKSTEVSYSAVPSQSAYPALQSFPHPWLIAFDKSIACYFPTENPDLAVLSLPTFDPQNFIEFSDVIRQCLATADKMKKKKLIIDLRGNGGGDVNCAYDMFKQLFPSAIPWGTTNFRAWALFKQMTQIVSTKYAGVTPETAGRKGFVNGFSSVFNGNEELNVTLQDYASWQAFYGPVTIHDDTFTHLVRYNLSSKYVTGPHDRISGYRNLTNIVPKQTFAAEDILLLQDGQCASTCTVFSEFMKTQSKVGSVVMGGRAQTGPMQAIGGTKGANDYTVAYLASLAEQAYRLAPADEQKSFKQQWGPALEGVNQALTRALEVSAGRAANINFRNNIRKGDDTVTPLQFVYEAADCRLFYTAKQVYNQALVWKAAYASYWSGAACVAGSTNQLSSKPGTGYILASPGAKSAPSTPKSEIVSSTSKGAGVPVATAAMAAMVPAFAAGAMLF